MEINPAILDTFDGNVGVSLEFNQSFSQMSKYKKANDETPGEETPGQEITPEDVTPNGYLSANQKLNDSMNIDDSFDNDQDNYLSKKAAMI